MELIYFFAALGIIAFVGLVYSLVCIHKEKRANKFHPPPRNDGP
jgi:hypothetical protein